MADPNVPDDSNDLTPEQQARKDKMSALFDDLDDGDYAPETLEEWQDEHADLQEQLSNIASALKNARADNAELRADIEAINAQTTTTEARFAAARKVAMYNFAQDVAPVVTALETDLKAIDADTRASDVKYTKIVEGIEKTIGQLTGVFNKYGVAGTTAPSSDAPAAAPSDKPNPEQPQQTPAAPAADTIEGLQQQCNEMMQQIADATSSLGKAQRDTMTLTKSKEEARKVVKRNEEKLQKDSLYALEKITKDVLPVVDTMELGLRSITPALRKTDEKYDSLAQRIQRSLGDLTVAFNKHGITEVNPVNAMFDIDRHEIISAVPREDVEPETILNVTRKGYVLHDRVVRTALVVVASDPSL